MVQAGFNRVRIRLNHQESQEVLRDFAEIVRRRDTCSQLLSIPEADYQSGLQQIDGELRQAKEQPIMIQTEVCLIRIFGEKAT